MVKNTLYGIKNKRKVNFMGEYVIIHIYIDKNKDMLLVPYKVCKAGYALATEPYKKVSNVHWEHTAEYILDLLKEVMKQSKVDSTETNVMELICGKKGFKHFSKEHICIEVKVEINNKKNNYCPFFLCSVFRQHNRKQYDLNRIASKFVKCIGIKYKRTNNVFFVSNQPRLPDGSYGTEKDSISERYCIVYTSTEDKAFIQENFVRAYKDGKRYLHNIGEVL